MIGALLLAASLAMRIAAPMAQEPAAPAVPVELPARLASQVRDAEALAAAIDHSALEAPFTVALRAVVDAHPGDPDELPFVPVRRGRVPIGAFRAFTRWQEREGEGRPQVAIDRAVAFHPIEAIVEFDRQLAARGIELLVVLLPTRLEIHPELVMDAPATGFAGLGSGTQRFVAELAREGVDAISLTQRFVAARHGEPGEGALYLEHDPHLTPRGYELAARATAERLRELPGFVPGSLVEGRDFAVVPAEFGYQPGESLMKRGAVVETVRGSTLRNGSAIVDLSDPAAPLVVLGDSHARLHSFTACDYVSQVARFAAQKVDFVKADGGAADTVRQKLGRREPERFATMKTVVWLLSETIVVPSKRWRKIAMAE